MNKLSILHSSSVLPQPDGAWKEGLPRAIKMRSPRIWQMAYAGTKALLEQVTVPPQSLISATALGALEETKLFLDGLYTEGFGSPRSFIASVHNSMAGKLAIDFKIPGPNLTICDGQNSFASALVTASLLQKSDFPVLLLAIDERTTLLDELTPYLSDSCKQFINSQWEEAAIAFLLDHSDRPGLPQISAYGPKPVESIPTEEELEAWAKEFHAECKPLPLSETSDSFIKPALSIQNIIANKGANNSAVFSYSPSAKAMAATHLCL